MLPAESQSLPRISQITDPSNQNIHVNYDAAGNLSQLMWTDATTRVFLYENASLPWALTGIVDENAHRYSTYAYDTRGRATDTQLAGSVDRYSVIYNPAPEWTVAETYDATLGVFWSDTTWVGTSPPVVTLPSGSSTTLGVTSVLGIPRLTSRDQPAGSGCAASTSQQTYDANANIASHDDFNGNRSCYLNDLSRNLAITRVDGLANTVTCASVTLDNATLPAGSRKVSTQWHPDWRLATRRTEPRKLTTYVYNGQPDPLNGNALASCAPTTALLPDGKPIAVLCKTVEQATTDVDGSKGFIAPGADPYFANVALLLHADGPDGSTTFIDSAGKASPGVVSDNARIRTDQSRFGGASAYFDGTGDFVDFPNIASARFNAGDFTVEAWIRPTRLGVVQVLFSQRDANTGNGWHFYVAADGGLLFQGAPGIYFRTAANVVAVNAWQHVAVSRSGSTITIFVDGVAKASSTSISILSESAAPFRIGGRTNVSPYFEYAGYIDEIRVTPGVARYTGNFTPPSEAFPPDATMAWLADASVPSRTRTYTYNQFGQVLTAKGPRTDVNETTTYSYYADTTAEHTLGDLQSVTNAVGKVTTYPLYNKYGQVLRMVDANNIVTDYTYDLRQRLKTVSVAGQVTSYDYWPTGLLKRVTQPDSSYVDYGYDDAHRLTSLTDHLGNRIEYTLDNAGNRTAENVKDPAGALSRQLTRVFDALGRAQQTTGRE